MIIKLIMILPIFYSTIFYFHLNNYLREYVTKSDNIIGSLNVLLNSGFVVLFSNLFLNNYISDKFYYNTLLCCTGFYINDIFLKKNNKKELLIKSIHHFISFMGIITFDKYQDQVARLFFTEITNFPLQLRNISKELKFSKKIGTICIIIFYFMFLKMRVIDGNQYKNEVCSKNNIKDCVLVNGIHLLWIYWFCLLNLKIFQVIKYIFL